MASLEPDFVERLYRLTQAIYNAAMSESWDDLARLTQERADLLATDAARERPRPENEAVWREVERLNQEALRLTEGQLQNLGNSVQTVRNRQRLQQSYGSDNG